MNRLDGIRATGTQRLTTFASNGDLVTIILNYQPTTRNWKMDIEWISFELRGQRIYSSPNLLIQYQNIIPFGLAVITSGSGDPFLINDFSSRRSDMFILTPAEVEEVNDFYVSLRNEG